MMIRTNSMMDGYLKELNYDFETSSYPISEKLTNIIQADFIDNNDSITLFGVASHTQNPLFETPVQKCEWEYNETHFHPDWSVMGDKEEEMEYLKAALESGKRLAKRLQRAYSEKRFRVIISFSETVYDSKEAESYSSSTVRFYQIRPEAEYLMRIEDLNDFKTEALMEIEF
jgi:hypothetical protein